MGCFFRGVRNGMGCYVRVDKNSMGCFVQGGKSLWDVLSGVLKMAWDMLSCSPGTWMNTTVNIIDLGIKLINGINVFERINYNISIPYMPSIHDFCKV